jgi:hypothetical protein
MCITLVWFSCRSDFRLWHFVVFFCSSAVGFYLWFWNSFWSSMTEEIIYNNMHLDHLIDIDDFDML